MNQPKDPMQRLAAVERSVQNLINSLNTALSETARLKARVRTLEIECGLAEEAGDAEDSDLG